MAAILIAVYYYTTGTLTLFSSSTGPAQFQDVLSSIPIRRPFSRSVQIANIIIRLKQFESEAPQIFLLPVLLSLIWRRVSDAHYTFVIASFIVIVSWLLFEGAEINYLMHLLPLLFLGLAIAATVVIKRWKIVTTASFTGIAILFFICSLHDSSNAFVAASGIDQSNYASIHTIEANIATNWHRTGKPRVLTEPITLDRLSQDTNLETMTDHFISFPLRPQPIDSFFKQEHVNFVVLYNSPVYPKNRERDDPFYQDVLRSCRWIASYVGTSGDMGRNYFDQSNWQDTLLLFQWPR